MVFEDLDEPCSLFVTPPFLEFQKAFDSELDSVGASEISIDDSGTYSGSSVSPGSTRSTRNAYDATEAGWSDLDSPCENSDKRWKNGTMFLYLILHKVNIL